MKRIYLFAATILASASIAIAQPTLTSTNITQTIGDSQLYHVADTNTVINTTTGANVVFDYSGLAGYGLTQTQYTLDPTSTEYGFEFPSATLADSTAGYPINKNYAALHGTDSLTKQGIVANVPTYGTVVGKYNTNPETNMKFPFAYGGIFFDLYSGIFTVNAGIPVSTDGNGNVTVSADAWGTLLLPSGVSIDSVLRVKTTEYLVTDTIVLGFPFNTTILPITISGENINYYKPSLSSYPLLSVVQGSYTQDNTTLDSTRIVISQYPIDILLNTEEVSAPVILNLYPNPSNNGVSNLTITLKEATDLRLDIFNNLGQNVTTVLEKSLPQGENNITLNTAALSNGIYFVKLTHGNETITKKLIIE